MAKKKKGQENLHFSEFREMATKLKAESDRGAALIISSWIEDALTDFVIGHLLRDEDVTEAMFGGVGPLGSFSSKIKLAYLSKMINKTVYNNLETIRSIRNDFAHLRADLRFSTQSISDRCGNLLVKGFDEPTSATVGDKNLDPRKAFAATGFVLITFLIEMRCAPTFSADGKEDYFFGFIKNVAEMMKTTNNI